MSMDHYDIAGRAKSLPDTFADRTGDELPILRSYAEGGEWEELLDDLVATLQHTQALVTAEERDEIAALLAAHEMTSDRLDDLNVAQR